MKNGNANKLVLYMIASVCFGVDISYIFWNAGHIGFGTNCLHIIRKTMRTVSV